MAIVYVFAHFDDEYAALPLLLEGVRRGLDQRFLYVADYPSDAVRERRHAETNALMAHVGIEPHRATHVGRGTGAFAGSVHQAMPRAYAALEAAVARIGPIERFIVTAWEGGHMDHDACALMASRLAQAFGNPPVEQISLYNGRGLPGPLFRAGSPLPENGPTRRVPSSPRDWLLWMLAVRFYRSQATTWVGLWPTMFWTYARRGFCVQRMDHARVLERPHAGPLLYERRYKQPYECVRAAADDFLARQPGLPRAD
jgi:LmbE family N-acetylglucosaminyl deacetylase